MNGQNENVPVYDLVNDAHATNPSQDGYDDAMEKVEEITMVMNQGDTIMKQTGISSGTYSMSHDDIVAFDNLEDYIIENMGSDKSQAFKVLTDSKNAEYKNEVKVESTSGDIIMTKGNKEVNLSKVSKFIQKDLGSFSEELSLLNHQMQQSAFAFLGIISRWSYQASKSMADRMSLITKAAIAPISHMYGMAQIGVAAWGVLHTYVKILTAQDKKEMSLLMTELLRQIPMLSEQANQAITKPRMTIKWVYKRIVKVGSTSETRGSITSPTGRIFSVSEDTQDNADPNKVYDIMAIYAGSRTLNQMRVPGTSHYLGSRWPYVLQFEPRRGLNIHCWDFKDIKTWSDGCIVVNSIVKGEDSELVNEARDMHLKAGGSNTSWEAMKKSGSSQYATTLLYADFNLAMSKILDSISSNNNGIIDTAKFPVCKLEIRENNPLSL